MLRGFLPGSYVRVEIEDIPYEFGKHFNLNNPIILGGLLSNERQLGYLQVIFFFITEPYLNFFFFIVFFTMKNRKIGLVFENI